MSSVVRQDVLISFQATLVAFSMGFLFLLLIHKQILSQLHGSNQPDETGSYSLNSLLNVIIVPLSVIFLFNLIIRIVEVMR